MEIEAWFLAETAHFPKIDPSITVEEIKKTLLFDPENDDMSLRLRRRPQRLLCDRGPVL